MNLKGMRTSIQCHLRLKSLQAFALIFFIPPISCKADCKESNFKRLTKSKCLLGQSRITETTASRTQCAIRCLSCAACGYFSYCNGVCHMHQPFYYQKLEDYDCDCSSYILLKENGQNWQKVFKLTERSYERSPLYLYWENLPIEKVKFLARATQRDFVFIFNGTGTDSTSWYRNDKLIEQPLAWNTQYNFTSNNDITEPYFRIDYGATSNYGNWMETKIVNGTYEIYYNSNGKYNSITELVISVLFK